MNENQIPPSLHHLIPLAEKWGIEDDGDREEILEASSNEELIELIDFIDTLPKNALTDLDNWFLNPKLVKEPSFEYLKFSAYFLSFQLAKIILKDRNDE